MSLSKFPEKDLEKEGRYEIRRLKATKSEEVENRDRRSSHSDGMKGTQERRTLLDLFSTPLVVRVEKTMERESLVSGLDV